MRTFILIACLTLTTIATAQVGIGTTMPKSVLDIPASNSVAPTNQDGLLIPRISAFPTTNPTIDQNGMMVFLTTDLAGKPKGFYYWDDSAASWLSLSGTKGWELLGNSGTNPAVNFIGTTDDNDVVFRRNNVRSGLIGTNNSAFGSGALGPASTGTNNTAIGSRALAANTNGTDNIAVGSNALQANQTGNNNTAVGTGALSANKADGNVAVGNLALGSNDNAIHNTAVGTAALRDVTYGSYNTAMGHDALMANTGYSNTAFGASALRANLGGQGNTAFGRLALTANTIGTSNTAMGIQAMYKNQTGSNNFALGGNSLLNNVDGNSNSAIGFSALYDNISGSNNTALGAGALNKALQSDNIAIGAQAASILVNGSSNVAIGNSALLNQTGGSGNISIGTNSQVPNPAGSNQLSIGNVIFGTTMTNGASGKIGIGENVPGAKLHVSASSTTTPANTDGIIIPRVSTLVAAANMTAAQNGLMVYLTADLTGKPKGFYYWESVSATWKAVGSSSDGAFYEVGSIIPPDAITDNMYHTGNVAIGKNTTLSKLDVEETNGASLAVANFKHANPTNTVVSTEVIQTEITAPAALASGVVSGITNKVGVANSVQGYGTTNILSGANTDVVYGTSNQITVTGNALKLGTHNSMTGSGSGLMVGTRNSMNTTSVATGVENNFNIPGSTRIGTNNYFGGTSPSGSSYGIWNSFASPMISGERIAMNTFFYSTGSPTGVSSSGMVNNFSDATAGKRDGVRNRFGSTLSNNVDSGVNNYFSNSSGTGDRIGIKNEFSNATANYNDNGDFYGAQNSFIADFAGKKYGTHNTFYSNVSSTAELYGSYTDFAGNANMNGLRIGHYVTDNGLGGGTKYGYYTKITNTASAGFNYGVYSDVGSDDGYAGYFEGKSSFFDAQIGTDDGQSATLTSRTRAMRNDGTGYASTASNRAVGARNVWGDLYSFGVAGYSDNDFNRTGGVLGSSTSGAYWASLGYANSTTPTPIAYGIYASAAGYAQGAGRMAPASEGGVGIGGGFYGGVIGSWSKGSIGQISSGDLLAAYNSGDEYTAGRQVEIVETGNGKKAAYTMTSASIVVYEKGKVRLVNGTAHVAFEEDYANLLGDTPIITATPMGECNGVYIAAVDKAGFTIKELGNGSNEVSVSWIAVGERADANSNALVKEVLEPDFDRNINEVMFNENNTAGQAKGIWSENGKVYFGAIPKRFGDNTAKDIPVAGGRQNTAVDNK